MLPTSIRQSRLAFEFVVLTATRSGEVRGALWSEIDLETATWTIPAGRMKGGREHRVPLSGPVLEVLDKARRHSDGPFGVPPPDRRPDSRLDAWKATRQNRHRQHVARHAKLVPGTGAAKPAWPARSPRPASPTGSETPRNKRTLGATCWNGAVNSWRLGHSMPPQMAVAGRIQRSGLCEQSD